MMSCLCGWKSGIFPDGPNGENSDGWTAEASRDAEGQGLVDTAGISHNSFPR